MHRMSGIFEIDGRLVILDNEYHIERQSASHGRPGRWTAEPAAGLASCNENQYLRGTLVINSTGCRNNTGATGGGRAEIEPTQQSAEDTGGLYLRDGDRAMCSGNL